MTKGATRLREKRRRQVEKYMREASPEKYHDLLIPDFDVGCNVYIHPSKQKKRGAEALI